MFRAGRLDRSFYTALLYDEYATGNAVLVAAVVGIIPVLPTFSVLQVALSALSAILRAVLAAAGVWAAGVYLFRRNAHLPVTIRLVGFAQVAILPVALIPWITMFAGLGGLSIPLMVLSALWLFLALRIVAISQFDLGHPENSLVAAAGLLGWYIGMILF